MSWIHRLYETYNNCESMVGKDLDGNTVPLLPICHSTQQAHIEIVLDGNGSFRRASVVPKREARTIIPCTEESGGRTSGVAAHPLCDKLQYVAGDYAKYTGSKKAYFESYQAQLEQWCASPFAHPKACAILQYVQKRIVIEDLISHKVLYLGPDDHLLSKWDKKTNGDAPPIFEVTTSQSDAFIRWVVEIPGDLEPRSWRDRKLWDAWIQYYLSTRSKKALCYVTGEETFRAEMHPSKVRNDGDKAKIISSGKSRNKNGEEKVDDPCGFTFLGRFTKAEQAATVGLEATQKAHYALRWLISRQGYRKGDLAIVAWANSGNDIPQPTDDPTAILGLDDLPSDPTASLDTAQEVAVKLKKRIAGYAVELGDTSHVMVIALNSATPGRLAVTYYQELTGSDFLKRIDEWHDSAAWIHRYKFIESSGTKGGKGKKQKVTFVGAPAPIDIAEAAYGQKADDRLKQATVLRILPCIVEGRPIPRDLVMSAVRRACNRVGLEHWEWEKTLSIACSLIKLHHRKENYSMALDPNRKTREYLYGRLLALAEGLEAWALSEAKEKRETNAARLMQRFAERPFSTWRTISLALRPYEARLGGKANYYKRMIDEVIAKFDEEDFLLDKPLSGEFLLGYHCQREALYSRNQPENVASDEANES